jgi:hypothetical protein
MNLRSLENTIPMHSNDFNILIWQRENQNKL